MDDRPTKVQTLERIAERFDSLADTAEVMGDDHGANHFRRLAHDCRGHAMALLDG